MENSARREIFTRPQDTQLTQLHDQVIKPITEKQRGQLDTLDFYL